MITEPLFHGTYTALVTPFLGDKLDFASFERLLATQQQLEGVVVGGTTGEAPALTDHEFEILLQEVVRQKNPSFKLLAGIGSNVTRYAVAKATIADRLNVDALLVVTPYYNKPSCEGLFQHFSTIAQNTEKPIILYSVPSRCGLEISLETLTKLREKHPHIIGLKEASEQCARIDALKARLGHDFTILSGNDSMTLPFMILGACGVISVASNIYPQHVQAMVKAMWQGNMGKAQKLHSIMAELFKNLFIESNPVPIKHLLAQSGILSSSETRLPLVELTAEHALLLEATFLRLEKALKANPKEFL